MVDLLSTEELDEVITIVQRLDQYVKTLTRGTLYRDLWYVGVTGQEPNEDGDASRIDGHKAEYKNMDEKSWYEKETSSMKVAHEIESRLHKLGYNGKGADGRVGNTSLNPNIVYVFKMYKNS